MWKILPLLVLALFADRLFAQDGLSPAGNAAEDLLAIGAFYPRLEGSSGEKSTIAFITSHLEASGTKYTTFDFEKSDLQHSFSSCIRVDVAGALRDTLIIAVPLDNPPRAGRREDGAVNIAIALGLLEQLKGDTLPPISVTMLFLGAEFGSTPDYPMGSNLFLSDFQPDYRVAVLYLNLRGRPSRVLVRAGGTGIVSPYWLMDSCIQALRKARVPYALHGDENQAFRLGLAGESTIIEPFLKAGYPSVSLEGEDGGVESEDVGVWLSAVISFFTDFMYGGTGGIPEEWDRHYLLFQEGGASLIVTERAYVVILLITLTLSLLYSLVFRKGVRKYVRTLVRNSWSIIPLFAIPFLLLLVATYALEGILAVRRFPTLWTYAPLTFLLLKLAIPLLAFSALYGLLRRLPFSRKGSFYSAAALFFLLVDILVVSAINISFSFYFLWAFFFVLLAASAPNRWLKLILFIPSIFWGARGMVEVFTMPALPLCRIILLSPLRGNLLIAAFILPFILFMIRIGLVFRGPRLFKRGARSIFYVGAFSAASIALAVGLLLYSPFGPGRPQPVTATQTIDEDTGTNWINLVSPAPIGEVTVLDSSKVMMLTERSSESILSLPPQSVPVTVSVEASEFLNKKNMLLQVSSDSRPRSLSARLTSTEEFILLDCSFPFVRESAHEYRLLIGAFPPDPLAIQLTLPTGMRFTLTLAMDFDTPLVGVMVVPKVAKAETHVHYVRSLELRT